MSGYVYVCEYQARYAGEGQRTPCKRRFSPSTMGFWEPSSGHLAWRQAPLPAEPSYPSSEQILHKSAHVSLTDEPTVGWFLALITVITYWQQALVD